MRPPYELFRPVTVQRYAGEGSRGPVYDDDVTLSAVVDDERRLVRNDQGDEVTSETTLMFDLEAFGPGVELTPESVVTLPGRSSRVVAVTRHDKVQHGAWAHVEVNLL